MRNNIIGSCIINELNEPTDARIVDVQNGKPIIEARLMSAETKNRNGRRYKYNDIKNEVYGSRTKELTKTRNQFGEAGHPITTDIVRQSSIDPKCISHNILDMWMDGNDVYGKIIGTPNECGNLFSALIQEGTQVAFSLRALGTLIKGHDGVQVNNPKMITFDWVIYPSFPNAYQTKVLNESANFTKDNEYGIYLPNNKLVIESKNYDPVIPIKTNKVIEEYILDESKNLKDVISQMEIIAENYQVDKSGQFLYVTEAGTHNKYQISLETKITNDILDYYGNL